MLRMGMQRGRVVVVMRRSDKAIGEHWIHGLDWINKEKHIHRISHETKK